MTAFLGRSNPTSVSVPEYAGISGVQAPFGDWIPQRFPMGELFRRAVHAVRAEYSVDRALFRVPADRQLCAERPISPAGGGDPPAV